MPNICDLSAWDEWLATAGIDEIDLGRGLSFNSANHVIEEAIGGTGVLLAYYTLAHDDLRKGRLITPFATSCAKRWR